LETVILGASVSFGDGILQTALRVAQNGQTMIAIGVGVPGVKKGTKLDTAKFGLHSNVYSGSINKQN
jgi:hypothetical protein